MEAVLQNMARWLGFPAETPRASSGALRHGDAVCLRPAGGAALTLSKNFTLSDGSEPGEGAVFAVERAAGVAGPVQSGEEIFFRATSGAHLGPSATSADTATQTMGAPRAGDRYGHCQRFCVHAETGALAVLGGDAV